MKIHVVGSQSQIGQAFCLALTADAVPFSSIPLEDVESLSLNELVELLDKQKADFIVNTDHIEGQSIKDLDQKLLEHRHLNLPRMLAKAAEHLEVPYLQISDFRVFSGNSDRPYKEEEDPHAQTLYGLTRWQGELAVQRSTSRYIVLRVGTLFCEDGRNCMNDLLEDWQAGKGNQQSIANQFSPTPAVDVARVLIAIIRQLDCGADAWGIYHYCSADIATPYDFSEVLLAAYTQFGNELENMKLEAITEPDSKQPLNSVLNCVKILNTFGIRQRPWRGELTRMIENIKHAEKKP